MTSNEWAITVTSNTVPAYYLEFCVNKLVTNLIPVENLGFILIDNSNLRLTKIAWASPMLGTQS